MLVDSNFQHLLFSVFSLLLQFSFIRKKLCRHVFILLYLFVVNIVYLSTFYLFIYLFLDWLFEEVNGLRKKLIEGKKALEK